MGYPVAVDNDFAIWRAFGNQYWPALYLIDTRGRIRYRHFGGGEYQQSERMIQKLLAEAGAHVRDADQEAVVGAALADPAVQRFTEGKTVRKRIHVPNRLLNLIIG